MSYSPMQVSEMLKIPPSSLRRYSVAFASYLSPQAPHKKRTYNDSDIATLKRIKDLARKFPLDQIGPRLSVVEAQPAEQTSALALIPEIAARFELLENDRQRTAQQVSELSARLERLEASSAHAERLRAWAALPWYRRLFTPPPE
jgi:DNA-binding transcriptional MerR regulator